MKIENYADVLGLTLNVSRPPNSKDNHWCCNFENTWFKSVKKDCVQTTNTSFGSTPDKAVRAFAREIREKTIMIHKNQKSLNLEVPKDLK